MNTKLKLIIVLITTTFAAGLSGCEAETRIAPRSNIRVEPMHDFALGTQEWGDNNDQNLLNNKFFLWKNPLPAQVSTTVLRAASAIDENEDLAVALRSKLRQTEADLDESRSALESEIGRLDPAVAAALQHYIELKNEQATLAPDDEGRKSEIDEELKSLNEKLGNLPDEARHNRERFDGICEQYSSLMRNQFEIGRRSEELVQLVVQNTDYFEQMPERVTFNFRPSGVAVTIQGWPKKNLVQSTENHAVQNSSYDPHGGTIRFDVLTTPGAELYRFRLTRSRLHVHDGRIFYQGDMDRYRIFPDGSTRLEQRGVAKLATSN